MITRKSFFNALFWALVAWLFIIGLVMFARDALADCVESDYNGTWTVSTDRMDMDGIQCATSCSLRLVNGTALAGTKCEVALYDTTTGVQWTEVHEIASGFLEVPTANAARYAEQLLDWTITNGVSFSTPFLAQREHSWPDNPKPRSAKCSRGHSVHGQVFSPDFGMTGFSMVWRGPSTVQP